MVGTITSLSSQPTSEVAGETPLCGDKLWAGSSSEGSSSDPSKAFLCCDGCEFVSLSQKELRIVETVGRSIGLKLRVRASNRRNVKGRQSGIGNDTAVLFTDIGVKNG
jgi:hypothetical protein